MRSILVLALSMMLFAELSCAPARSGNRMIAFKPDRQSIRYRAADAKPPTRMLTGIIKDDTNNSPIEHVSIELYAGEHLIEPIKIAMTTLRGGFNFKVVDGYYTIVISHSRFREKKITAEVKGFDVELNDVRLEPLF